VTTPRFQKFGVETETPNALLIALTEPLWYVFASQSMRPGMSLIDLGMIGLIGSIGIASRLFNRVGVLLMICQQVCATFTCQEDDLMADLKFKQIAVMSWRATQIPNAAEVQCLYGLTEDGKVFAWSSNHNAWGPMSMKEVGS
jgi:hypothetical protein